MKGLCVIPVRTILNAILLVSIMSAIAPTNAQPQDANNVVDPALHQALRFRSVGPHRGGRVTAATGYVVRPFTFLMGTAGGGIWRTTDPLVSP
jgi:hypothetical protein